MPHYIVYQGSEDWSALYKDGSLLTVGDHYLIDEKIRQEFDIETIQSDDFMQGGGYRDDVAKTIDALHQYRDRRLANEEEARLLRERAAALIEQAKALEGKKTR